MNSNENLIKVGDRIQKPVIKGYSTGVEEHIETFLVVEILDLGKGKLWAGGHMVGTTDPRGDLHLGREDHKTYIAPVDYFAVDHSDEPKGMLDMSKMKKVS
ncbi:hypothetical protein PBI_ELVA_37 [Microbacterium phage Elva]|uniref:hypothetical protein n=1 Tax=Microbacterium phage Elva TaxID=2126929 RepID=UPI000D207BB4|nr:hypothetical protein QDW20_gp37 [Microbacterium phage Elva]AVR56778.1 hypothetical protein PBI_ELVA_37 [Microbacterium phage Elva]